MVKRKSNESKLVTQCIDLCGYHRHKCIPIRINNIPRFTKDGRAFFAKGRIIKGAPDILLILKSTVKCETWHKPVPQAVAIECKTDTGRLSKDQLAFKVWFESMGGVYHVVTDIEEMRTILNNSAL